MATPRIAVIVVSRRPNESPAIAADAALASGGVKVSVFIVHLGSNAGALRERYAGIQAVEIIEPVADPGFGGAANEGINLSLATDTDFIAVLEAGVRLEPGALGRMAPVAARRGIACPRILRPDGRLHSTGGCLELWFARAFARDEGAPDHGQNNVPREVEYAPRPVMMFSRDALETGVRFSEGFFDGHEDADCCLALAGHGFTTGYVPDARALFQVSVIPGDTYYQTRNRLPLVDRWGSRGQRICARLYLFFIIPAIFAMLWAGGRRARAQAVWRGWMDSLHGRHGRRTAGRKVNS